MIRPEIIYLLIPARRPEIFANKLNAFKRLGKVWFSVAQSTRNVRSSMRRTGWSGCTYPSVIFAPTCIPIASKRSLSPSSSSSTFVAALETRLVVESLCSLRIAGVGSGAGSRPASIISCSTLRARAWACADDARRVLTISIKNKSNAAPSINRTGASAIAVTRGEEREPVSGGVVIGVTSGEDD